MSEIDGSIEIFRKKLKKLKKFKGRGTELISLYIPENADRSSVMGQITEELSQSSNIKSPQTRKNVQGALRKLDTFLKNINFKIPKNGLVLFCGNVSETEGRSDIKMFPLNPIKPLKTKLYWCDSSFHLDPVEDMQKTKEVHALIVLDKREATVAILKGKSYEVVGHFTSNVAGKTRAGGQCLSPETLIQLNDGSIIPIKESHNPLQVKSFDFKNNVFTDSNIKDKWKTKKSVYKIITKYPRTEIVSSKDHLFFTAGEEIKEKSAEELKVGEFLLMPEKIEIKGKTQFLESFDCFNSYHISENGKNVLINTRKKAGISQKKLGKKTGITQTGVSVIELGKRDVRKNLIKKLCKELNIDFEKFIKTQTKANSDLVMPKKLTKELSKIIGYFVGDGSFEKERISFSEQNKELAEHYKNKVSDFFNANSSIKFRENKGCYQIRIYGKSIVKFIEKNFSEIKKARNTEIPLKILKSENDVLASFIKGFYDAEGYATSKRGIGLGINNKKMAEQLRLSLLRFGIIASLHKYDNKRNPYSDNPRFTVDISDNESLKLFSKLIGFSLKKKQEKIMALIKNRKHIRSNVRQIIVSGKKIRKIIEEQGYNLELFPKVNSFFRNERQMSKKVFNESILGYVKNKKLKTKLKKLMEIPLIPAKINKIIKSNKKTGLVDISVLNQNFIANGLIVHNSSHRFERLREEAAQDFFKRTSEKINKTFEEYGENLKGVIVGGPGITKNRFLEKEALDYRLKEKIIGVLDTSYTDESGIREMIQKSEELLRDTALMKERGLMNRFLEEIVKDGLVAYGENEVIEALKIGKAETVLLSEGIEWTAIKFKCISCNSIEELIIKDESKPKLKCSKCKSTKIEELEELEYAEFMEEKAKEGGASIKIISTETSEGEQFFKGFGGIGAFLRYK